MHPYATMTQGVYLVSHYHHPLHRRGPRVYELDILAALFGVVPGVGDRPSRYAVWLRDSPNRR